MATFIFPAGFDRATGTSGLPGTPTPVGSKVVRPDTGSFFEETSSSPQIERGEQATFVHAFRCDKASGITIIQSYGRGTIFVDSYGFSYKVLSLNGDYQKGDYWEIKITCESISFDVPPDEFEVSDLEFNPPLYQHPRYKKLVAYAPVSGMTGVQIINAIQNALALPQALAAQENAARLNDIADADVKAQSKELLSKLRKGIDSFYLAGFKVTWSQYFFTPVDLNPGGFIQDPVTDGGLPEYFWKDVGGNNIFEFLAATVNPNIYADGLSWLRQCDTFSYTRTIFKITRSWIGGPLGKWDEQIYKADALPPA